MPANPECDQIRRRLLELGGFVRERLREVRGGEQEETDFAAVARQDVADTIYEIDRVSEEVIAAWFQTSWPRDLPVEVAMEGVDPARPLTFPAGTDPADARWKLLLDPIDGTRGLMYDKRPAWFLAGAAPQRGPATTLVDIEVAVMVELPTSKQWRSDALSAIRGAGCTATATNVLTGETRPLALRASRATRFDHGFACFSRFFPAGKALTAHLEEALWTALGYSTQTGNLIFEDQYICTGGQFYELIAGHDRMIADLRPLVHRILGIRDGLHCHPYDVAASLVVTEAGLILEKPFGGVLDAPLDTTSSVAWVAYANRTLATQVRPALRAIFSELLPALD
ncbi:MAG: inositol monophosphatase [Verrucomicrobia bacterium]|nr:inositol monophosphatase [Verrucomicrobiota bacterium]